MEGYYAVYKSRTTNVKGPITDSRFPASSSFISATRSLSGTLERDKTPSVMLGCCERRLCPGKYDPL